MFVRTTLFAAAAATLAMSAASVSADTRTLVAKPQPQIMIAKPARIVGFPCPDGWVPATPPLNWQLGCLPNTMTLGN